MYATWARTLPPVPSAGLPRVVHLRREYFSVIEALAVSLRPVSTPQVALFVGLVDSLDGNPDETGHVSGDVQLLLLEQEGQVRARVNLGAQDYHTAWEAHGVGGYVTFRGVLEKGERAHRITSISDFQRLGQEGV